MDTVTGFLKKFEGLFYVLMVAGAINYGIMGLFGTDVIGSLLSGASLTVVLVMIGIAGLLSLDSVIEKLHHM